MTRRTVYKSSELCFTFVVGFKTPRWITNFMFLWDWTYMVLSSKRHQLHAASGMEPVPNWCLGYPKSVLLDLSVRENMQFHFQTDFLFARRMHLHGCRIPFFPRQRYKPWNYAQTDSVHVACAGKTSEWHTSSVLFFSKSNAIFLGHFYPPKRDS